MIVLGLDPGTAIVGWGLVEFSGNKITALGYGVIETDKTLRDGQRLLAVSAGVQQLLITHRPEMVAVEKLFFSNNQKTVMTVSQARGVLLLEIERQGLPYIELTPQQVKQGATGYGSAGKKDVQIMVQRLLGLAEIPQPDDAADALAIALTGGQLAAQQKILSRYA